MAARPGFVLLVESTSSSRSRSGGRGHLVGAARVAVLEEDELCCTVRYEQVSGPPQLVGELATYPRSRVYIEPAELRDFADLVRRFWGPEWRGQGGR